MKPLLLVLLAPLLLLPMTTQAQQTAPKPFTVVVWGDSIAAGGWPALAERGFNVCLNTGRPIKVINCGIGGMPAANARRQFAEKITANAPDLVIIQFGLNDLRYDGSRGDKPLSTLAEFEEHLTDMGTRCLNEAHAKVVFFGNHKTQANLIMPTGRTYDETRADYSAVAAKVAAKLGVSYHDLSKELKVEGADWTDFLVPDGVHLSEIGLNAYGRFAAGVIRDEMK